MARLLTTMRDQTKNWLDMTEYDLKTANHMLRAGRNIYVVFMCHLAIEKILKAIFVETTGKTPPKTHDLILLSEKSSVEFPRQMSEFVGIINNASVATRYPHDLSELKSSYPKKVAEEYLKKTKEATRWLKKHPRLKA